MRKIKLVSVVLLCIAICGFIFFNISDKDTNHKNNTGITVNNEETIGQKQGKKTVVQCDGSLTNLSFHDYTVLIIGHNECEPCSLIKNELSLPLNTHIHAFYLDVIKSNMHKMVAYALRTSGFPTVYLIDNNHEIKSILRRTINLEPMLSSSIVDSKNIIEEKIDNLDESEIRKMLSASLKATLALNKGKYEDIRQFANESIGYGSYFFNNWLLYTYYLQAHKTDSANYYKSQALNHVNGVNGKIYYDLIENLK